MTLAFKVLEMSASYEPQISEFKFGRVTEVKRESRKLTIKVDNDSKKIAGGGRFEVEEEQGADCNLLSLMWSDLILPRIKL